MNRIVHLSLKVEDLEKTTGEIKAYGCQIISDPGVVPVKFRAPGGTVAELVPGGRYKKPKLLLSCLFQADRNEPGVDGQDR